MLHNKVILLEFILLTIISEIDPPDGTIGNTKSSFTTLNSIRQGLSFIDNALSRRESTSPGLSVENDSIPNACPTFTKSGLLLLRSVKLYFSPWNISCHFLFLFMKH